MSLSLHVRGMLVAGGLVLACPALVSGQTGCVADGSEYAPAIPLAGDQVFPQASISPAGGFLVWQDNTIDGDGWGISAQKVDANFSADFDAFRVNTIGAGDQSNPQVSLLNGGGAAFVWQGGAAGFPHIKARFLSTNNTWTTGSDVAVNTFTNDIQVDPVVATLTNGNVLIAWGSFNEAAAGSMQDVYARLFTPAGAAVGGELAINQTTAYNQRSATVATLSGGGFVVAWVSEQQRFENGVDVYARLFNAAGVAQGGEFLVNTSTNVCSNPSVAAAADGGFAVAWSEKDLAVRTNGWDVFVRTYSGGGVGGAARRVNTRVYGDQLVPKISFAGGSYLMVWTSLGQDGSGKGVYGQTLQADGAAAGGEFRVNTTTVGDQMQPAVAADGGQRFLVTWTSFAGGLNSFDARAQRYAAALLPPNAPSAPYVTVLSSTNLMVSWPPQEGYSVANYEVYADGAVAGSPTAAVTNSWWTMNGLTAGSTHTFRLAFVLADGRRSALSTAATGTTYSKITWGGIPVGWMSQYFGSDSSTWPVATAPVNSGGPTLLYIFLSGGNPLDSSTWLRMRLTPSAQGFFLSWNPQPGLIYQVQSSTNMSSWANLGLPRYAAGTNDAINVGGSNRGYYRVLRLR